LPTTIGDLSCLEILYVYNNELTELPAEIAKLRNLHTLCAQHNNISTLPPQIFTLTSMKTLYLHDNKLKELCGGIGNMSELTTLTLERNVLSSLPIDLIKLNKLEYFTFFTNDFDLNIYIDTDTVFGKWLEQCNKSYVVQTCANSGLVYSTQPGSISKPKPPEIDVIFKSNVVRNVREKIKSRLGYFFHGHYSMTKEQYYKLIYVLNYIDSKDNSDDRDKLCAVFSEEIDAIVTITRDRIVAIVDQYFQYLTNSVNNDNDNNCVQTLKDICYQNVTLQDKILSLPDRNMDTSRLEWADVDKYIHLNRLKLSRNKLKYVPVDILSKVRNLRELYLSHNLLQSIPPEINTLTQLSTLYLSSNKIKVLVPELFDLPNLKILFVNYNLLEELPVKILCCKKLRVINIKNNCFKELPDLSLMKLLHIIS
jgi:Leucine-rich repeat (LRR) protein